MRSAPRRTNRVGPIMVYIVTWAAIALMMPALPTDVIGDEATLPPVSGGSLSDPDRILPADVLARVELLRANVDLLRRYMGKSIALDPILRVEGARPYEVYAEALNLQRRGKAFDTCLDEFLFAVLTVPV